MSAAEQATEDTMDCQTCEGSGCFPPCEYELECGHARPPYRDEYREDRRHEPCPDCKGLGYLETQD